MTQDLYKNGVFIYVFWTVGADVVVFHLAMTLVTCWLYQYDTLHRAPFVERTIRKMPREHNNGIYYLIYKYNERL